MRKVFAAFLLCAAFVSCTDVASREIPDPYKARIIALRADNVAMHHKCTELTRQIADMKAQADWDTQEMDTVAHEALNSLGYSPTEYRVDIDKMKVLPVGKR